MKKELCSVVVPCMNEEDTIPIFYDVITKVAENELPQLDFEFWFIDDGSEDSTLDIIKGLQSRDSRVHFVSFSRNFGKEAGIYAGLEHSAGDYAVIMDVDLQDPPELLKDMYNTMCDEVYDCVAARRVDRKGEPPIRSFFARQFYKLISRISDADIVDGARDYRLMKRKMVKSILDVGEYNRFSKGIFGWVGFKTKWLEINNVERSAGETKWNFWKLFLYAIDGIIAFSTLPLSIASFIGLMCCALSMIGVVFIFVRALIFGDPVAGWPSLVCIITLIGGIQLLCMGIIGMYLSKTYLETKRRPIYISKEEG